MEKSLALTLEFYLTLRSLKRASLRLSCPKERLLTRKRILCCIPMFGSCRNRHIFTLFGMQPVQERRSTDSLKRWCKTFPREILLLLSGIGCRRFWSWVPKQDKTARSWLKRRLNSFGCHTLAVGMCGNEILKITSSPDAHLRDCLSEGEDPKDTLLKASLDRLFWVS